MSRENPGESAGVGRRPLVFGHRGASARAPENTLAAFELAFDEGADGVELDVRLTADGVPVVCHDPVLADGRPVATTLWAQLPPGVPTLVDVLDAGPWLLNVEIKPPAGGAGRGAVAALVDPVVGLIRDRGAGDRVLVSSFDLDVLDRVRAVEPGLDRGWLVWAGTPAPPPGEPVDLVARAVAHGAVALHPADVMVDRDLAAQARAAGLALNVWTVDDPARMADLARLGVDGVITNDPALARQVFGRSGPVGAGLDGHHEA